MSKIENEFLTEALAQVPRLLGQINRNPGSKTYGSFDRAFWHYRTNDISSCRYQEAVYTLTLLYCSPFEGNIYYRDARLFSWIRSALSFTVTLQQKNGSFDEWYVHEGSYVGTAFLTAALSQTLMLFRKHDVSVPEAESVMSTIRRSAQFLVSHRETTVLNQMSGAVFAIHAAGEVLGEDSLKQHAAILLTEFLSMQQGEGWWSEYGGPDVGYLSLTISYLHKYEFYTRSGRVIDAILKARNFIEAFIQPDLTAGGEYMSRNTEYVIPSGALPYLGGLRPKHLDDRYLCYILYNWIEAGLETVPYPVPKLEGIQYFSEAGIVRIFKNGLFLAANGRKGGSFRLYYDGKVYYDSGMEMFTTNQVLSTGILDAANRVSFKENALDVSGNAKPVREPLLSTTLMIPFKLWQLTVGRFSFLQGVLKKFLRTQMISYTGKNTVSFKRAITYTEDSIIVADELRGVNPAHIIHYGAKAAYTAVPSSKYAPFPELAACMLIPVIEEYKGTESYTLKRTFRFSTNRT